LHLLMTTVHSHHLGPSFMNLIVRAVSDMVCVCFFAAACIYWRILVYSASWLSFANSIVRAAIRCVSFFLLPLAFTDNYSTFTGSSLSFTNSIVRAFSDIVSVLFFCYRLHLLTNSCRFRPSRTSFANLIVRAVSDMVRVCFFAATCIHWRILVYSASFVNSIVRAFSRIVSFLFFAAAYIC